MRLRQRSGALEVRFALYAALALLVGALVIVATVRRDTMRRAERNAVAETRLVARAVVPQVLGAGDFRAPVAAKHRRWLDTVFKKEVLAGGALRVKLYSPSGLVTYSTNPAQIGQETDDPAEIIEVMKGKPKSDISRLNAEGGGGSNQKVIESYVPVFFGATKPVGVLEIYEDYAPVARAVSSATYMIAAVSAAVLAVIYALLLPLLRRLTRRLREQLATTERIATHDGLTGLPNRLLFQEHASLGLDRAHREGGKLAVLLLDLDHFKDVNDTLGHEHGDRLLVEVAQRLQDALADDDTIARLGGDEFGFVAPVADMTEANDVAQRLLEGLAQPIMIDHLRLHVRGSVGFALFPDDGGDTETLLRKADVAMYAAKELQAPVAYSAEHDHYSPDRLALLGELEHAIEHGQLVVHFQPVADLRSGEIRQLEALVRWQHPERGLLAPAEFVDLAEQAGMINQLTMSVLRTALAQCATWRRAGHDVSVAVNVSGRDLGNRSFATDVERLLQEARLPAAALALEISENTILTDPLRMTAVLHDLHRLGVGLAIDDFGAGHTSLGYLRRLPVDTLKIDRSFLIGLEADPGSETIVHSAIELAHRLELAVVAEGVETTYALERLDDFGCDLAQGFLLGRAVPADLLELGSRTPYVRA